MRLLLLLLIALTFEANAGEKGNGGDVVVCADGSVELLDYYEGRHLRNLHPIYELSGDDDTYFAALSDRLIALDAETFKDFPGAVSELRLAFEAAERGSFGATSSVLFTDQHLVDVQDSEELIVGAGCSVVQIAIQTVKRFPEDPSYIIRKDLFNRLSARDRRGLILHEALYRVFIRRFHAQNSIATRYFHQRISSKEIAKLTMEDLLHVLRLLGASSEAFSVQIGGRAFGLKGLQIEADGTLTGVPRGLDSRIAISEDVTHSELTRIWGGKYGSLTLARGLPETANRFFSLENQKGDRRQLSDQDDTSFFPVGSWVLKTSAPDAKGGVGVNFSGARLWCAGPQLNLTIAENQTGTVDVKNWSCDL
jgi:hypothetical protein